MSCYQCSYKRDQPGTSEKSCRAIKEHHVFRRMSLEEKGNLEVYASTTGKLPYTTPDGKPLVKLEANPECYWPATYLPEHVEDCKLFTLREDIVGFKNI
jgi:hypothetical protein